MKKNDYEGKLQKVRSTSIYLNVDNLKKGNYILKIINKNNVIKKIEFNKK
ncbi:hypothetical protein [Polaribacter sp.]